MKWKKGDNVGDKNPMFGVHLFGADNGFYGKSHSSESKEKIRQKAIGRKHTQESKKKLSERMKGKIPWNAGTRIIYPCECGWTKESGQIHLCHHGCGQPTTVHKGQPRYYVNGHGVIGRERARVCKCGWSMKENESPIPPHYCHDGCGNVTVKREHDFPNYYIKEHVDRGGVPPGMNPSAWKAVSITRLKMFFLKYKTEPLYPRPEHCAKCDRPAKRICLVDYDPDKIKRRDPSIFQWLCFAHWHVNRDG